MSITPTITITPVNYIISSNENIFELIKVDIIKQLYADGYIDFVEDLKIDKISAGINYVLSKPLEFAKNLSSALSMLHPILEVASKGATGIHAMIRDFSNFEKSINDKLISDEKVLLNHAQEFHSIPGTYLEFDIITVILKQTLESIKKNKKKESILIIDDLDRLDPEHIFRILNILSSHTDHISNTHKFGFDRVLLVADINNIENLFKHRYGTGSEFTGYIDKFYSEEIFQFRNTDALNKFLKKGLKVDLSDHVNKVFSSLLGLFLDHDKITMRNIIKYKNLTKPEKYEIDRTDIKDFRLHNTIVHVNSDTLWFDSDDVQILYVISFLSSMFGDITQLKKVLTKGINKKEFIEKDLIESYISSFAIIHRYINEIDKDTKKQYFNEPVRYITKHGSKFKTSPDLNLPKGSCFGINYRLGVSWSGGNQYLGDTSFFKDIKVTNELNDKQIAYDQILNSLLIIIQFVEKKNWFYKLNISS